MPPMLGAPTRRSDGQRIGLRAGVIRRPSPRRGARASSPPAHPPGLGRGSRRVRGGGAAGRRGCRHGRRAVRWDLCESAGRHGCRHGRRAVRWDLCESAGRHGCRHGRRAVGWDLCESAGRHGSRHGRGAVGWDLCESAGRHGSRHGRRAAGWDLCDPAGRHGSRHGRRAVRCHERHGGDAGWHGCRDSPATAGSDSSGCAAEHEHAD